MPAFGRSVRSILVEVGSIVLGVLLALGVSEWAQQRDREEQAENALRNVAQELRWNLDLLERLHTNNAATLRLLDEAVEDDDAEGNIVPGLQLRETAYQTLVTTGIANYIGFDRVLSLSETYSMQGVYKHIGRQLAEAAMAMAAHASALGTEVDNQHYQRQFRPYFDMLVAAEELLLGSYRDALQELGSN